MPHEAPNAASAARAAARRRGQRLIKRKATAKRRERIFARLVCGASFVAIAREENCTVRWVRKVVAEALAAREVDQSGPYAQLQIARLSHALEVAEAFMINGDLAGMDRYVKIVEQLDRYYGAPALGVGAAAPLRLTAPIAPRALPAPQPVAAHEAISPASQNSPPCEAGRG
jgi:hypothetical protein